jgi:hypothetical protein
MDMPRQFDQSFSLFSIESQITLIIFFKFQEFLRTNTTISFQIWCKLFKFYGRIDRERPP